eukprot:TRINITY_DN1843_c0_g2_i1.p1 TRINITY_DN1843_c0_g2~~TRINITY_DN1843_c0_g2_i1.p1  ORF type:complete len:773 (-),score=173.82 TRINITY_DN1843_c0_g2_i1:166-2484(-)
MGLGRYTIYLLLVYCICWIKAQQDVPIVKTFNFDLEDIQWSSSTVGFILTTSWQVYRTSDEGSTWILQSTNAFMRGVTKIDSISMDTVDPNKVLFFGESTSNWQTLDGGQTYTTVISLGNIDTSAGIYFHPSRSGYVVAHTNCNDLTGCTAIYSGDMGKNWDILAENIYQARWGTNDLNNNPVVFLHHADSTSSFGYTPDLGKSFVKLIDWVTGSVFTSRFIFVGALDLSMGMEIELLTCSLAVSGTCTSTASFSRSHFPFGDDLPNTGYTILDDSTGAAWLGVNHGPAYGSRWGNIYISGEEGYRYSLAIEHVNQDFGIFDYSPVHGLEGVYLANNITNWQQNKADKNINTLVSWDNGGQWAYLTPPTKHADGSPILCTGTCTLNLHGETSWLWGEAAPFYTNENAIGLIVAVGSIGEKLDTKNYNTYLSRDGGVTWQELASGLTIYEFGDHGGILVYADYTQSTNTILYTLDEGTTPSQSFQFDKVRKIKISNIITSPGGTGQKFMVLGTDGTNDYVYTIDFSPLKERVCGNDDYEEWTPSDGRTNKECLLGRRVTYSRRKPQADCFNDRDTDHIVSSDNCVCEWEDWECDLGYTEQQNSDGSFSCALTGNLAPDPPADCPPETTYTVSKGYRKVVGDSCIAGLDLSGVTKWCPGSSAIKSYGWVAAVVVSAIVLALIVAGFFAWRNERVREKIVDAVFPIVEKIRGLRSGGEGSRYSRVGVRPGSLADEEFGLGGDGEGDLEDDSLEDEEGAKELGDNDIANDSFEPRG